jgi:plasmid rolling circle replication initiator protein Rep
VPVFRKVVTPEPVVNCVSCPTCSYEIPVQSTLRIPREFSVLCPNCGWRREYLPADLHDARRDAELIREIPRIQFGKKNVKKVEEENIFIQPETRLNQLASWLLQ